jgi:hypothetical protein
MFGIALSRTAAVARQLIPNLQSNSTLITNLGRKCSLKQAGIHSNNLYAISLD